MNKKLWVAAIIGPLVLAALIAWIMTPSPERAFRTKLAKLGKMDKVSWELSVNGDKYQQYKSDGVYYAEYFSGERSLFINVDGDRLLFGTEDIAVSTPVLDSKLAKSTFWFDKITPEDVSKGSVSRVKGAKEDVYTATLNDGTPITVTFYKGIVSKIEYDSATYSRGILSDNDKEFGAVSVLVNNVEKDVEVPESLVLRNVNKITLDEFETYMDMSDEELEDENPDLLALKDAYMGNFEDGSDDEFPEDTDEDDISDDDEDLSSDIDEEEKSTGGHFEFIPDDILF